MAKVSNPHFLERKKKVENLSTRPPMTITPVDELWQALMSNEQTWSTSKFSVLMSRIEYYRMIRDMFAVLPLTTAGAQDEILGRIDDKLAELYTSLLGPQFKRAMEEIRR